MKRSVLYIFTVWVLCLMAGCHRTTQFPLTMQRAESLMNARPDSAWQLLQSMEDTVPMLSEEARMYWHLLGIQARDKLMLAYYQGRVYRD